MWKYAEILLSEVLMSSQKHNENENEKNTEKFMEAICWYLYALQET